MHPLRSESWFSDEVDGDDGDGYYWQLMASKCGNVVSSMVTFGRNYSAVPTQ